MTEAPITYRLNTGALWSPPVPTLYAYEDHAGFVITNRETDDPYSDAAFVRRATAEMIADGFVTTGFHESQRAPVRIMGKVGAASPALSQEAA